MTKAFDEQDLREIVAYYMRMSAGVAQSGDVSPENEDKLVEFGSGIVEHAYSLIAIIAENIQNEQFRSSALHAVSEVMNSSFKLGGHCLLPEDQQKWLADRRAQKARDALASKRANDPRSRVIKDIVHAFLQRCTPEQQAARGFVAKALKATNVALGEQNEHPISRKALEALLKNARS